MPCRCTRGAKGAASGGDLTRSPVTRAAVLDRLLALHGIDGWRDAAGADDLGARLVGGLSALLDRVGTAREATASATRVA